MTGVREQDAFQLRPSARKFPFYPIPVILTLRSSSSARSPVLVSRTDITTYNLRDGPKVPVALHVSRLSAQDRSHRQRRLRNSNKIIIILVSFSRVRTITIRIQRVGGVRTTAEILYINKSSSRTRPPPNPSLTIA